MCGYYEKLGESLQPVIDYCCVWRTRAEIQQKFGLSYSELLNLMNAVEKRRIVIQQTIPGRTSSKVIYISKDIFYSRNKKLI